MAVYLVLFGNNIKYGLVLVSHSKVRVPIHLKETEATIE